ncbi:hypothetical protein AABB24_020587 [Solanum stoloniferum]|uniref:Rab-GAP TBC domain-containing protein n=2 Tax=Solanum stoloniferum TaxID=62892 RepID=A0ABD2T8P9_9SOLN
MTFHEPFLVTPGWTLLRVMLPLGGSLLPILSVILMLATARKYFSSGKSINLKLPLGIALLKTSTTLLTCCTHPRPNAGIAAVSHCPICTILAVYLLWNPTWLHWFTTNFGCTQIMLYFFSWDLDFKATILSNFKGLNYVAALLLLVMKTEEEAFWMIAVLLENVLVTDCYNKNLSGCHVEQRVFKDLLTKKCPRIAAHLEALEFDVSLVCTEWFLCLFAKSLPSETTLRVWDVLFNEGANLLFHVALAIFKMNEEELLTVHHVGDVIHIIQRCTHQLFDPDDLLTVICSR